MPPSTAAAAAAAKSPFGALHVFTGGTVLRTSGLGHRSSSSGARGSQPMPPPSQRPFDRVGRDADGSFDGDGRLRRDGAFISGSSVSSISIVLDAASATGVVSGSDSGASKAVSTSATAAVAAAGEMPSHRLPAASPASSPASPAPAPGAAMASPSSSSSGVHDATTAAAEPYYAAADTLPYMTARPLRGSSDSASAFAAPIISSDVATAAIVSNIGGDAAASLPTGGCPSGSVQIDLSSGAETSSPNAKQAHLSISFLALPPPPPALMSQGGALASGQVSSGGGGAAAAAVASMPLPKCLYRTTDDTSVPAGVVYARFPEVTPAAEAAAKAPVSAPIDRSTYIMTTSTTSSSRDTAAAAAAAAAGTDRAVEASASEAELRDVDLVATIRANPVDVSADDATLDTEDSAVGTAAAAAATPTGTDSDDGGGPAALPPEVRRRLSGHLGRQRTKSIRNWKDLSHSMAGQPPGYWLLGTMLLLVVMSTMHLAANMALLLVLASYLESLFGCWRLLPVWVVAGVAGNMASAFFENPCTLVVGSSGAVFGLLGAFVADAAINFESIPLLWLRLAGMAAVAALLVALQITGHTGGSNTRGSSTSHASHAGGFLSGGMLAWLLLPDFKARRSMKVSELLTASGISSSLPDPSSPGGAQLYSFWQRHKILLYGMYGVAVLLLLVMLLALPLVLYLRTFQRMVCG
ncbi:hypothetical protein VOLCADRAFT_95503 [Volvox carteri f. nagariensis]|uniref:RHOMBOID-like protein n=1 Tax=Volvox carteri f. nagariensis TaxID=3068 RepID=D8U7M8_VOLCA|nr:uncharacterized protein VOLCADRAFT_95503 [Volvox carteri f. nagariensis]EFJ44262.1 hypothetical protein VOLCADRAFT_95503 [Volvox carteri f. nagariensis]|eukprot:XP_002954621.1 hypothetical protein VOLCADRAFT_95503 [Volvox carteri f. nagariensis]